MSAVSSMFLFTSPTREEGDKLFIPKVSQFTVGTPPLVYTVFTTEISPCEKMYIMTQPADSQRINGNVRITSVKFTSLNKQDTANISQDSGSSYGRCENHKIVDIAYYDEKLLSVLLVEDTDDQVPVLLQLPLHLITEENFITMTATASITMATDIPVINVGSMIEAGQYRRLDNMRAHSFAVSGSRHTATVLFSSRRRVRIFLMDAEEEDEEEEEDEAEISIQSEADQSGTSLHDLNQSGPSSQDNNQSEMSMQIDSIEGEEGQEDKENSSILSGGSNG